MLGFSFLTKIKIAVVLIIEKRRCEMEKFANIGLPLIVAMVLMMAFYYHGKEVGLEEGHARGYAEGTSETEEVCALERALGQETALSAVGRAGIITEATKEEVVIYRLAAKPPESREIVVPAEYVNLSALRGENPVTYLVTSRSRLGKDGVHRPVWDLVREPALEAELAGEQTLLWIEAAKKQVGVVSIVGRDSFRHFLPQPGRTR